VTTTRAPQGALASLSSIIGRVIALIVIDAFAILFAYGLNNGGLLIAAVLLLLVTFAINVVFLVDRLYPLRWISPGVFLLVLMVVYPVAYTVYIAFTNFSGEHNLSKDQVVAQLAKEFYTPEGAPTFTWQAYRNDAGDFKIVLTDPTTKSRLLGESATGQISPIADNDPTYGAPGQALPPTVDGFTLLSRLQSIKYLTPLSALVITGPVGGQVATLHIESLDAAVEGFERYVYDASTDTVTDKQTGTTYHDVDGFFSDPQGNHIGVGFSEFVGLRNFQRVLSNPQLTADFFGVFTWTFIFSGLSVFFCFTLGLALALVFNDDRLPLKGLFRTLAIIPYTIPGFISALVWVGLMNPNFGPINAVLKDSVFHLNPQWFSDGTLAKAAIFIINTWLGYPYMLIVVLGALQSIPTDLYEAAQIDGASAWQRFRTITFPLLMVAIAPLLIGSFAFNFNNFTLIDLVTEGGPPRPGSVTPAGQTDILISYSFRLAFASGKGNDYAFAAAISIFIFAIVATITLINFRLSRRAENLTG
jgi:ABC-type sugar transport system permease subunit